MTNADLVIEQPIDRLLIVGPTGAGKSFAARQLSSIIERPLISLDKLMLDEFDQPKPKEQFVEEATAFFEQEKFADGWVVDGTYRSLRQLTWDRADVIGYIRPNVCRNIAMVVKRGLTNDTLGGNSEQPVHAQLRRLCKTRKYDLEKIDDTTEEYRKRGTDVVVATAASKLVGSIVDRYKLF